MRNNINLLILCFSVFAVCACKTDPDAALKAKLTELEAKVIDANGTVNNAAATEFIAISGQLTASLKGKDPNAYADLQLKTAALAKTMEQPQKALELYSKIADDMPQHPKAPTALFMMAFIQENDLGDLVKAKGTYEAFLQRYPNDPDFADDAQNALKLLGKSPEELFEEFQKKNAETPQ